MKVLNKVQPKNNPLILHKTSQNKKKNIIHISFEFNLTDFFQRLRGFLVQYIYFYLLRLLDFTI